MAGPGAGTGPRVVGATVLCPPHGKQNTLPLPAPSKHQQPQTETTSEQQELRKPSLPSCVSWGGTGEAAGAPAGLHKGRMWLLPGAWWHRCSPQQRPPSFLSVQCHVAVPSVTAGPKLRCQVCVVAMWWVVWTIRSSSCMSGGRSLGTAITGLLQGASRGEAALGFQHFAAEGT